MGTESEYYLSPSNWLGLCPGSPHAHTTFCMEALLNLLTLTLSELKESFKVIC